MKIDIFREQDFWNKLTPYNEEIRRVCSNYTFARESIEKYDLKKGKVSYWFDPNYYKHLHISHIYPKKASWQFDSKWKLILYFPNYVSLFVISKLFGENTDVLIEDQACGMGRFIFFLNKLGFKNFQVTEKYTQVCKELLFDMLTKIKANVSVNGNNETDPDIINLIGWTHMTRQQIPKNTRLLCLYNQEHLIKNKYSTPLVFNSGQVYVKVKGFTFLCSDKNNLCFIYCKKEDYEAHFDKLSPFIA